jgi:plastocyanin
MSTFLPRLLRAIVCMGCVLAASRGVHAGSLRVAVSDEAGKPLESAVVFLDAVGATPVASPDAQTAVMDQIGKQFVPQVLVVPVGAKVTFPNSDNIRHHVYSFSEARNFELPLYAGTPAEPVRFPVAGVVVLGCNIHDWMRGYIVVVSSPFHAVSGADGIANITGVPPGTWRVMAWHRDLAEQRAVTGGEVEGSTAGSSAAVTVPLKRKLQLRRAPAGRGEDRY